MLFSRRDFLSASVATTAMASVSSLRSNASASSPKPKKLVLIAGTPSHGPGMHEHNAGVQLFHQCLSGIDGLEVTYLLNGYPKDDSILDSADGLMVYADGGKGHPLVQGDRLNRINGLISTGLGLFCCHFGVEVLKGEPGDHFRDWIGGCYEHEYSCNPMWKAEFKNLPEHPITRGVSSFSIHDEWYFNMRFRDAMQGVTPILSATPSDETRNGPYVYPKGPYPHIQDAKGRMEHLMWCTDRADNGRGVGFTGGHFHKNWADDNFRKLVLNALLWICKHEVPSTGVESKLTDDDMAKNLDPKNKK